MQACGPDPQLRDRCAPDRPIEVFLPRQQHGNALTDQVLIICDKHLMFTCRPHLAGDRARRLPHLSTDVAGGEQGPPTPVDGGLWFTEQVPPRQEFGIAGRLYRTIFVLVLDIKGGYSRRSGRIGVNHQDRIARVASEVGTQIWFGPSSVGISTATAVFLNDRCQHSSSCLHSKVAEVPVVTLHRVLSTREL